MRECVCVCGKNEWGGRVGGGKEVDGGKGVGGWKEVCMGDSVWEEGVCGGRGSVWGERECV